MRSEKYYDGRNSQGGVGAKRRETPLSLGEVTEGSLEEVTLTQ